MIRASYILFVVFASVLFAESRAEEMPMGQAIITEWEKSDPLPGEKNINLTQDNSPSLFVYWDERVRTTVTGVHEHNRLMARTIITLLKQSPLSFKYFTDSEKAESSYAEYHHPAAESFIVALHRIRI